MANPSIKTLTVNTWEKVATNVTAGAIKKMKRGVTYLETYRMTGNAAPTDQEEGAVIFTGSNSETIAASAGIDVYIMAVGRSGKVRVDIP